MDGDDLRRLQRYLALFTQRLQQQHDDEEDEDEEHLDDSELQNDDDDADDDDDIVWVAANRNADRSNDPSTPSTAEQNRLAQQREQLASALVNSHIARDTFSKTGCSQNRPNKRISDMISKREICSRFTPQKQVHITQRFLPIQPVKRIAEYAHQAFCGQFSADGSMFMSASQDCRVRLYDTCTWKQQKEILARDIGWSIIDTDYSPDGRWIIYSSWSDYVHLCNIRGEEEIHEPLDMQPNAQRFCLFSVSFSPDSRELIGGSSDRSLYIYDLDRRQRTLKLEAHSDDVNTVAFADESAQILLTGSDDCLIKVWDRRLLRASGASASQRGCIGVLTGHTEGITHIDSRGDGRYLVSNGKDQVIKLWDLRSMSDSGAVSGAPSSLRRSGFDYRYGGRLRSGITGLNDQSLMSYRGHKVFQTLIRCYFSPAFSTGQRYIYSGSYDGCIYIYDVLTGALVSRVCGHRATVRDVSWHPTDSLLLSTSWDGSVGMWNEKLTEKSAGGCASRRCL